MVLLTSLSTNSATNGSSIPSTSLSHPSSPGASLLAIDSRRQSSFLSARFVKMEILCSGSGTEFVSNRDSIEEAFQTLVRCTRTSGTGTHGKNQSNTLLEGRISTDNDQHLASDGRSSTRTRWSLPGDSSPPRCFGCSDSHATQVRHNDHESLILRLSKSNTFQPIKDHVSALYELSCPFQP